ncbi:hypothetical protein ACWGJT_04000 [Streptomyces xantholiticus]
MKTRTKRGALRALLAAAAAGLVTSSLAATPAQAAITCNSGRLCLVHRDGDIQNVDVEYGVSWCPSIQTMYDVREVRNRSNRAFNFYWNNNQTIPYEGMENYRVATLGVNQTITFNPDSKYWFCKVNGNTT